jgi:hypothetical protein
VKVLRRNSELEKQKLEKQKLERQKLEKYYAEYEYNQNFFLPKQPNH